MTITKKRNAAMFLAALMIALLCMILVAPVSRRCRYRSRR